VVYHELGHATLVKQHTEEHTDGHPRIMDAYLPLGNNYWTPEVLEKAKREFFGGKCK
jgi:hypothetical protein